MSVKISTHSMIWTQIYLLFIVRLISNIISNNIIIYLCDLVTIAIFILLLRKNTGSISKMTAFFVIEVVCWCVSFAFGISGSVSALISLLRVFVRFYVIFTACCSVMTEIDYIKLFKVFDYIIFFHFALVLFQIFVLHQSNGDAVGGIFGIVFGYGNGASHALILFVTLITVYKYFSEWETIRFTLIKLIMVFTIAILTEMKAFIFEAMILIVLFMVLNKKIKARNVLIIFMMPIAGILFMNYMTMYYEFDIFSLDSINIYLESGYGFNTNGIGRVDGYEKVFEQCFNGEFMKAVFGMGFATSVSDYTLTHYGRMNLGYFTYAKIFYDVGIVGSILYFFPLALSVFKGIKLIKRTPNWGAFCIVLGFLGIYLNFYGNHMESDFCGYFYYILLSIPFVMEKQINETDKYRESELSR